MPELLFAFTTFDSQEEKVVSLRPVKEMEGIRGDIEAMAGGNSPD